MEGVRHVASPKDSNQRRAAHVCGQIQPQRRGATQRPMALCVWSARRPARRLSNPETFDEQIEWCWKNLVAVLEAAGMARAACPVAQREFLALLTQFEGLLP